MEERLLACGFTETMARDVAALYPDKADLERYVRMIELIYDGHKAYV